MKHTDIDIDMADRNKLLELIEYTDASMINDEVIKKHNVGIYLQEIPKYMDTNLSAFDYNDTGDMGYFKLDILNNSIYQNIESEEELDRLLAKEPNWDLLQDKEIVEQLFQVSKYYEKLVQWKPRSIMQLAMFIAMIRPSKSYLMNCNDWEKVEREIWVEPTDGSAYFKKSHSIAYANVLRIQLNSFDNL